MPDNERAARAKPLSLGERGAAGRVPGLRALAQRLVAAVAAGALVPSFAVGATEGMRNLVLWRWGGEEQKVVAWDEEGRLG